MYATLTPEEAVKAPCLPKFQARRWGKKNKNFKQEEFKGKQLPALCASPKY